MDVIVKPPCAEAERGDNLSRQQGLATAVHRTAFDQWNHGLGEHLGVHPQVFVIRQTRHHRAGNFSDARLQRRAVLHERCDEFTHLHRFGRGRLGCKFQQRQFTFHECMKRADVNKAVAERAGHVGIHLGDDVIRALDRSLHHVHRHAKAAKPVRVRRTDLYERDVQMDLFPAKQRRDVAQENRCVVCDAFVNGVAHVGSDEEGVVAEVGEQFAARVRRAAKREDVDDLHVEYIRATFGERGHERLRCGATGANEHPHAAA